jgi:hypothetical protein
MIAVRRFVSPTAYGCETVDTSESNPMSSPGNLRVLLTISGRVVDD